MEQSQDLGEVVRRLLQDGRFSRYQIFKETGVSMAVLSRFINGETTIMLTTLQKLADFYGLSLVQTRPAREVKSSRKDD